MGNDMVTLLCSAAGLGFYIPGLIVNHKLENRNIKTEVLVFENFISEDKRNTIFDVRKAYRENFKRAVVATKIPKDIRDAIDYDKLQMLLLQWKSDNRRNFISLSGNWTYVLDMYREMIAPDEINVDLLYVDSDLSPSWKNAKKYNPDYSKRYSEVWLCNSDAKKIYCQIAVSSEKPIPYNERPDRFLIHGGGWGMGTYQSIIPELGENGIMLDIVAYELEETKNEVEGSRYFLNDPSWFCWNKNNKDRHEFPPFSQVTKTEVPVFKNREDYHRLFDITREAKGIISKPGAGTLMDSLSSATPLIILESFGKHEDKNSELWKYMGFGIKYEEWKATGFSRDILIPMHRRLLEARDSYQDYTELFVNKYKL